MVLIYSYKSKWQQNYKGTIFQPHHNIQKGQEMSNQIYGFQYRRPRLNNPTQQNLTDIFSLSNSVASTLSFYNPNKIGIHRRNDQQQQSKLHRVEQGVESDSKPMKSRRDDFSLPKINRQQDDSIKLNRQQQLSSQGRRNFRQYGQIVVDSGLQNRANELSDIKDNQKQYRRASSLHDIAKKQQVKFPQNYITPFTINQKDIFMKQGHNYNIITLQPNNHKQCIKKYPKLSLQQKDQYFRHRYINFEKFKNQLGELNPQVYSPGSKSRDKSNKVDIEQKMAGMHAYRVSSQRSGENYVNEANRASQLNNLLQNNNNKNNSPMIRPNPRSSNFNMKLLSHMDEFNYYS